MAYFSSSLPTKKIKFPKKFTTIEVMAVKLKFGRHVWKEYIDNREQ